MDRVGRFGRWIGLGCRSVVGFSVLFTINAAEVHQTVDEPITNAAALNLQLSTVPAPHGTNPVPSVSSGPEAALSPDPVLRDAKSMLATENFRDLSAQEADVLQQKYQAFLDEAVRQGRAGNAEQAEKLLTRLLDSGAPAEIRKTALLQLAVSTHERQELLRAQQIYAQFLKEYPADAASAEVLLRQGLICRQLGAPIMALSKFYAVMSTALSVKSDRLEYYQRLVLLAQSEIADTYYLQGKHEEAADFFGRLMKLTSPDLDKNRIQYKLIRCLAQKGRSGEIVSQAEQFLARCPEAETSAEVRFLLAEALKKLGRNREAMEQVQAMLEMEQRGAATTPESWRYWRQRIGNDIANQLYQEGDYLNALQVYQSLAGLSSSPEWQLPAWYQIGLVYERLHQPQKAVEIYERVLGEQSKLKTAPSNPGLVAVFDMAKWRKDFLGWQKQADASNRQLNQTETPVAQ